MRVIYSTGIYVTHGSRPKKKRDDGHNEGSKGKLEAEAGPPLFRTQRQTSAARLFLTVPFPNCSHAC